MKRIKIILAIVGIVLLSIVGLISYRSLNSNLQTHPNEIKGIEVKGYSFKNEQELTMTAIQERYIVSERTRKDGVLTLQSVDAKGDVYETRSVGFLDLNDLECIHNDSGSNSECIASAGTQRGFFVVIMKYHPDLVKIRLSKKGLKVLETDVVKLEQVEHERQGLPSLSSDEVSEVRRFEKSRYGSGF